MMVYQNDELLVHYQPKPEEKQNQYSGTKSFTSTAVGFAVQEGLFSMEDYVLDYTLHPGKRGGWGNRARICLSFLEYARWHVPCGWKIRTVLHRDAKLEYVITIAQERNISKAAEQTCWQCRFSLPVCLWNLPECAVFPLAAAKGEEGLNLFCAVFHPATEPVPHIL